jgi:hypothetical protein
VQELFVPPPGAVPISFDRRFAASIWQQFAVLMRRWLTAYWRNPSYNAGRLFYAIVLACLLGTIYLGKGQKRDNLSDITNIAGALFICITFLGALRCVGAGLRG